MSVEVARIVLWGFTGWLVLGLLVGLAFVSVGIRRVDGGRGASVAFRLLILPGCAVMWPVLLRSWWSGREGVTPAAPGSRRADEDPPENVE